MDTEFLCIEGTATPLYLSYYSKKASNSNIFQYFGFFGYLLKKLTTFSIHATTYQPLRSVFAANCHAYHNHYFDYKAKVVHMGAFDPKELTMALTLSAKVLDVIFFPGT